MEELSKQEILDELNRKVNDLNTFLRSYLPTGRAKNVALDEMDTMYLWARKAIHLRVTQDDSVLSKIDTRADALVETAVMPVIVQRPLHYHHESRCINDCVCLPGSCQFS
jgi:hypothetical protein